MSDLEPKNEKILKDVDEMIDYLNQMFEQVMAQSRCSSGMESRGDVALACQEIHKNAKLESGQSMLITVLTAIYRPEIQLHYTRLLLLEGADVNQVDKNGCTPLMIAIEQSFEKTVKALIKAKLTNHYIADSRGWTALHHAAGSGREGIMNVYLKWLTKSEKNENILVLLDMQNNDHQTAKQVAEKYRYYNLAKILEDELNRQLEILHKSIGLIQHSGMPSSRLSRQTIKRAATFHSFQDHDQLDEERLLSDDDNDLATHLEFSHDKDEDPTKRSYSPIVMDIPELFSTANISINVGVKVGETDNRANFIESKADMKKHIQHDYRAIIPLMRSPSMPQIDAEELIKPTQNKQKLSNKIRSFITGKQRKHSLTKSASMDKLVKGKYMSMENAMDTDYRNTRDIIPTEDPFTQLQKQPKDVLVNVEANFQPGPNVTSDRLRLRSQKAHLPLNRPKADNPNKLAKRATLPPIRKSSTLEKQFSDLSVHVDDPEQ